MSEGAAETITVAGKPFTAVNTYELGFGNGTVTQFENGQLAVVRRVVRPGDERFSVLVLVGDVGAFAEHSTPEAALNALSSRAAEWAPVLAELARFNGGAV